MVTNFIRLLLRLVTCFSALTVAGTVAAAVITPLPSPVRSVPVEPAAVTEPVKVIKADPSVTPTAYPVDPSITPTAKPEPVHHHHHHKSVEPRPTHSVPVHSTPAHTKTYEPKHHDTPKPVVHHKPKPVVHVHPKPVVHVHPKPTHKVTYPNVIRSIAGAQAYARARVANDYQFQCLLNLWTRESGWQYDAYNPNGGAYGIPQSLPASKMASAGADYRTNAATQIRWGLGYISDVYGAPCGAWAHSERYNWY